MPIYSKTRKFHHIKFNHEKFNNLTNWTPSPDDIFYHHFYDDQQHSVKFKDCIDEIHWEHLRTTPSAKLFHENCGETFNYNFVNEIVELVTLRNINPSQIYIVLTDNIHRQFLETKLHEKNITGIQLTTFNFLLSKVNLDTPLLDSISKFSILSRNYRNWRLWLYCELVEKDLIKDFTYSFYNIHPYEKKVFTVTDMLEDLRKLEISVTDKTLDWLFKVPHRINLDDNVYNKWADVTYSVVASSDFHIAIETFFDPFLSHIDGKYVKNAAPNFITEKIYKPIACKKPFIIFGAPYILEDLKFLGYETFNKFINEDYDSETDNQKRLSMIVSEIQRISTLSETEYNNLLNNVKDICERNYQRLIQQRKNSFNNKSFDFIHEYL